MTSAETPRAVPEPAGTPVLRVHGKPRQVWVVVLLSLVTFGVYHLIWLYKTFAEVRRARGVGVGGVVGLLLSLLIVGEFLLAAYVGRMYREDGWDDPPISGWTGLWAIFPYVGGIVLMGIVQSNLNRFWDMPGGTPAQA